MSLFAMVPVEVIQDKRLTLEQIRVLIALLSFRNKSGDTVWPSRAVIAERTGMHTANISSATSALVELGWLEKEGKGGHSKATRYTIKAQETVAERATVADSATVAERANTTVAEQATRPLADSATRIEQTIEQTREQTKVKRVRAAPLPDEFQPDAEGMNYATQRGIAVADELENFRDYYLARGLTRKDWQASWRTWCRNAERFGRAATSRPPAPTRNKKALPRENFDAIDYGEGIRAL